MKLFALCWMMIFLGILLGMFLKEVLIYKSCEEYNEFHQITCELK